MAISQTAQDPQDPLATIKENTQADEAKAQKEREKNLNAAASAEAALAAQIAASQVSTAKQDEEIQASESTNSVAATPTNQVLEPAAQPAPASTQSTVTKTEEETPPSKYHVAGTSSREREANKTQIKNKANDYLKAYKANFEKENPGKPLPEWLKNCKYVETRVNNEVDMAKLPQAVQEHMKANGQTPPINMMYFSAGKDDKGQEIVIPAEFRRNFLDDINSLGLIGGPSTKQIAQPGLTLKTSRDSVCFKLNQTSSRPMKEILEEVRASFNAWKGNLSKQQAEAAKLELTEDKQITINFAADKPLSKNDAEKVDQFLRSLSDKGLIVDNAAQRQQLTAPPSSNIITTIRQETSVERIHHVQEAQLHAQESQRSSIAASPTPTPLK